MIEWLMDLPAWQQNLIILGFTAATVLFLWIS